MFLEVINRKRKEFFLKELGGLEGLVFVGDVKSNLGNFVVCGEGGKR